MNGNVNEPPASDLLAIVLAAGFGRRAGGPKSRLRLADGRTFLTAVVDGVRAARPALVTIVVGPWWGTDPADAAPEGCTVVVNPDPDRGQITSIRTAFAEAGIGWSGALVALVDHPAVLPETFSAIAALHAQDPESILVPVTTGADGRARRGHPVLFPEWSFPDLLGPGTDAGGAREVLRGWPRRVREVPTGDAGVVLDVDTPADRDGCVDWAKGERREA